MMDILLLFYLLIPILSVEGMIGWSIGLVGAYKAIKIYRGKAENKNKKAIKLLIVCYTIAVVYNLAVYYITKIVVSKFV